jgi:hypothetical protein
MSEPIPAEVLGNHTAVLGKTGSGKSSTTRLIVEEVAPDFRVCVLDTIKSDWWGITSSADGQAPGLPFRILGGPRGHIGLPATAGAAVGRLVAQGKLPLSILDMADFGPGDHQRFFVEFAEAVWKHVRGVLYLVIEEAHEFAPKERAGLGAESMAIHWAKKLATGGRSKGIRLIVATQRVQALHNAVLGSCETLIAHRLTMPADQKPVIDWLKANVDKGTVEAVAGSLASLPTGTGWLCSGEARIFQKVAFPKFSTFDNTATPTGDEDEVHVATAAVDHDELREILGAAVAEAEANDPKALRAEIARLRSAAKSGEIRHDPAEIAAAEERGYQRGRTASLIEAYGEVSARLGDIVADLMDGADRMPAPQPLVTGYAALVAEPRPPKPSASAAPQTTGALGLVAAAAKVHPVGLTWGQIATLAGRKPSGGHFNASRKTALDKGWLAEAGGLVSATSQGLAAVDVKPRKGDPADVFAAALPQPARKMFETIRERPGITLTGLASVLQMQPRGGHWNNGLATLRRNGLLREDGEALSITDLRRKA